MSSYLNAQSVEDDGKEEHDAGHDESWHDDAAGEVGLTRGSTTVGRRIDCYHKAGSSTNGEWVYHAEGLILRKVICITMQSQR